MSTILLTFILSAGYDPSRPLCEKWTWQGPPYNRKVSCLKWKKNNNDHADKGKRK